MGQRKALLRQRGKLELCFGLAVHLAPPERTEAAYEHRGGNVGAGLRPPELLVETTLMKVEDERLNLVTHGGLRVVLPPTELDRTLRLLLAVGEAAVHDRARRPPHCQVRQVERPAQLARDLRPRLDLAVGRDHVAELEESNDAKPVPQKRELAVARPLAEANDLIGDREALLRRLWPPERDEPSTERGGELPRVSELPRERERLLAQGEDPRRLRVPVEVDRQAREEPRPEPRVTVPEAVERFLEELDAGLVDDPAPHPEQTRALPGEAERAAGQERRVSDPSRDVGGLSKRLTCRGAIAGFPLRAATREQKLAALARVGRMPFCEDLERALEQDRRVLVRQGRFGVPRGSGAVRDRLLRACRRHRLEEMMREGCQVRDRVHLVESLQHLADAPVQPRPLGGPQLLVDGFPDQGMREAVPPRRAQVGDEYLAPQRRPEDLEQRVGSEPTRTLQSTEAELASDDRREGQGIPAGRGQGREAAADRLSHALRHRKPPRDRFVPALEGALGDEQVHDLVHEEGIAFGLAVDGLDECGGSTAARLLLDEERHLPFPETGERQVASVTRQRSQDLGDVRVLSRLHCSVRRHDEHRRVAQLVHEELQQEQRRRVGPLQVVEDEHQRCVVGTTPEERRHRIEEVEARVLRLWRDGRRWRLQPPQLRHELREVWRTGPVRNPWQAGPDHLNPRPVGRSPLALPAPPPEHEVTPRRGLTRQLLHEPGLPDARLPDDEEEASAAGGGVFQTRAQLHELVVSTDEDRRHRGDHSALTGSRQGRELDRETTITSPVRRVPGAPIFSLPCGSYRVGRDAEAPRHFDHARVVRREAHVLSLLAQEVDRGEVQRVQCPDRGRERLESPCEHRSRQLEQRDPAEELTDILAMRPTEPTRVHAGPQLVLEEPTRDERLPPK